MLKKEWNHGAKSLPKRHSGPKPIVCHHCGALGHHRLHYSNFQVLKRIKRKEKLELLGSCALQAKPDLGENGKLLKKVFDILTSLSMCISGSHSSNPRLAFHEILIPNNCYIWMRKGSYGWTYAFLVINLILLISVGLFMHRWFIVMHLCIMHLFICISFVFVFYLTLLFFFFFLWVKVQNHIKSEKYKKFDRICLSIYHMWVWPSTFVLMA